MPVPFSTNDPVPYVLERDRETPGAPVWQLRPLMHVQRAKLEDLSGYDNATAEIKPNTGTRTLETVRAGLVGWEGFSAGGKSIAFETASGLVSVLGYRQNVVRDTVLQLVPWAWLEELASEIVRLSSLTIAEGKG